jgi:hypothetical protein
MTLEQATDELRQLVRHRALLHEQHQRRLEALAEREAQLLEVYYAGERR